MLGNQTRIGRMAGMHSTHYATTLAWYSTLQVKRVAQGKGDGVRVLWVSGGKENSLHRSGGIRMTEYVSRTVSYSRV